MSSRKNSPQCEVYSDFCHESAGKNLKNSVNSPEIPRYCKTPLLKSVLPKSFSSDHSPRKMNAVSVDLLSNQKNAQSEKCVREYEEKPSNKTCNKSGGQMSSRENSPRCDPDFCHDSANENLKNSINSPEIPRYCETPLLKSVLPKSFSSDRSPRKVNAVSVDLLSNQKNVQSEKCVKEPEEKPSSKTCNKSGDNESGAQIFQEPDVNVPKARHASVPAKIHKQGNIKHRANTVMPSNIGLRKKNAPKPTTLANPVKKNASFATQRLLSARKLKIDDLRNRIIDLHRQLEESQKELHTQKKCNNRQEKELKRIKESHVEIPKLEKAHDEELRVLKALNRNLQDKIKDLELKLTLKNAKLKQILNNSQELKMTLEQSKIGEAELEKKFKALKVRLEKREEMLKILTNDLDTAKDDLSQERLKHEETKTELQDLSISYKWLQEELKGGEHVEDKDLSVNALDAVSSSVAVTEHNGQKEIQVNCHSSKSSASQFSPKLMSMRKKASHSPPGSSCAKTETSEWMNSPVRKQSSALKQSHLNSPKGSQLNSPKRSHPNSSHNKSNVSFTIPKPPSNKDAKESHCVPSTTSSAKNTRNSSLDKTIQSKLQDLSAEELPVIVPTSSDRSEGEFAIFTGRKNRQLNPKLTYLALDDVVTTRFTGRDVRKQR